MRDPDGIEALVETTVETYGGVDVLVNNAAVETYTGAGEATREDWGLVVETDFRGYWLCAREAVRHMDERGGGAVVNVASNHARLTTPEVFPYNAVKAGVEGMTRAMALDFGPRVRANAVAPGGSPSSARPRGRARSDGVNSRGSTRSVAWADPRTSPRPSRSWRARRRATSPERRWWSTAAGPP